jgi:hypothetical protein
MVTNGHLHLDEKDFGSRLFYYGYYWFNCVSWSIEDNLEKWPQLIHQISQKLKFLKLIKKRRHRPSTGYSWTVRIDRKISQNLWVKHRLSDRVALTLRVHSVHVKSQG